MTKITAMKVAALSAGYALMRSNDRFAAEGRSVPMLVGETARRRDIFANAIHHAVRAL